MTYIPMDFRVSNFGFISIVSQAYDFNSNVLTPDTFVESATIEYNNQCNRYLYYLIKHIAS